MTTAKPIPAVSFQTARTGISAKPNAMGMREMQERAYNKRGEQYLLIKSPPASGKSRALMFIALDKLHNQGLKQAIIVVPEKSIGGSFSDEPLSKFVSIGVQKGPPIGVQKGPPSSSGVTGLAGVLFALVAAEGGRSPTGGATCAKRLLPVVPGVSCGA